MKNIFFHIALSLSALVVSAQNDQPTLKKTEDKNPPQATQPILKYYCPKCTYSYSEMEAYHMHGIPLRLPDVKTCPECYWTCCDTVSKGEPANCHKCGAPLEKMDPPKKAEKKKNQKTTGKE
jgi:transcription initiation factor IIE alpha subunit